MRLQKKIDEDEAEMEIGEATEALEALTVRMQAN